MNLKPNESLEAQVVTPVPLQTNTVKSEKKSFSFSHDRHTLDVYAPDYYEQSYN